MNERAPSPKTEIDPLASPEFFENIETAPERRFSPEVEEDRIESGEYAPEREGDNKEIGNEAAGAEPELKIAEEMAQTAIAAMETGEGGNELAVESPDQADDGHKLAAEWVKAVKEALSKGKGDPRDKNRIVNKLKEEYRVRRFNRRIGDRN